jgi:hypothetical protein
MFFQREMDEFVNIFERNDHPLTFSGIDEMAD